MKALKQACFDKNLNPLWVALLIVCPVLGHSQTAQRDVNARTQARYPILSSFELGEDSKVLETGLANSVISFDFDLPAQRISPSQEAAPTFIFMPEKMGGLSERQRTLLEFMQATQGVSEQAVEYKGSDTGLSGPSQALFDESKLHLESSSPDSIPPASSGGGDPAGAGNSGDGNQDPKNSAPSLQQATGKEYAQGLVKGLPVIIAVLSEKITPYPASAENAEYMAANFQVHREIGKIMAKRLSRLSLDRTPANEPFNQKLKEASKTLIAATEIDDKKRNWPD